MPTSEMLPPLTFGSTSGSVPWISLLGSAEPEKPRLVARLAMGLAIAQERRLEERVANAFFGDGSV